MCQDTMLPVRLGVSYIVNAPPADMTMAASWHSAGALLNSQLSMGPKLENAQAIRSHLRPRLAMKRDSISAVRPLHIQEKSPLM